MHGEDPGQALAAGVGSGEIMLVHALGQEQIRLRLIEELESMAGVCLQGPSTAQRVGFNAEALQAGKDRALLGIVTKVVEVDDHLMACLDKPFTEAN